MTICLHMKESSQFFILPKQNLQVTSWWLTHHGLQYFLHNCQCIFHDLHTQLFVLTLCSNCCDNCFKSNCFRRVTVAASGCAYNYKTTLSYVVLIIDYGLRFYRFIISSNFQWLTQSIECFYLHLSLDLWLPLCLLDLWLSFYCSFMFTNCVLSFCSMVDAHNR